MLRIAFTGQGTIVALPRPAAMAVRATARFLHLEASGGILLIGAAIVALLMANSPLEEFYDHFREMPVVVQVGVFEIAKPLLLWINDGLMAVFFLLVSLEIKREALSGQLSTRAQVMLPVICAFAGVAVPALIYAASIAATRTRCAAGRSRRRPTSRSRSACCRCSGPACRWA